MQQIINFIFRNKNLLLYLFLLFISLAFTIQSHSYHQSKFFNSANWLTGGVYKTTNGIFSYFNLEKENQKLVDENMRLRRIIINNEYNEEVAIDSTALDSTILDYTIVSAKIIKNSYSNLDNYITLNKGSKDGIKQDMGVITPNGILGIIENTSGKFSRVQSILNRKSNLNAKLKNTDNFGSLIWDTKDFNTVQLIDIPRRIPIKVGDTILTGAASSIFPENIPIGTIKSFGLDVSKSSYTINISLFNDMSNLKNVYIINNTNRVVLEELESPVTNGK
ncbi:rod shape-determining protein MreC [Cellulophaga baltica]|jgi:rod shape-determining protein MreC|uniref:rod shape-determining protein MreC n=1 Tax=Cellulophaga baltica TaxID=76594 RepID=UPI0004271159|nr:rod shape-determining protein MreC [Cellulophaga baltica]AIY12157.1 rod shape-determining protein MreC [Cellulophaga baltica NN016038]MBA6315221.1 rod shape-determining protein MreC [Cellulophaga baltica]WFO15488.1 rod shape-determining protein MreC [Cellulophaga baltica 4]